MKILILKPSSLGDVIHALPVLRLLKRHRPASEIYWWLDSGLVPLLDGDPDLTGIIPFPRKRWGSPVHWPEALQSILGMREMKFDWVIDLQGLARSGAFAWLANGGLLAGLDEYREGARGFYDLISVSPSFQTHAVDRYLGVLPLLKVPVHQDFTWLPERPSAAAAVREKWPQTAAPWITLAPGARWENKRWPVEYFIELVAQAAREKPGIRFAILGSKADQPLGRAIAGAQPEHCLDLTGRTTLPEMIEWIRRSRLLVTNDTGPMHVAAALGRPVTAIFGPTEPRRTGPYGQLDHVLQSRIECVPCMKSRCHYEKPLECLRLITPEQVREQMRLRMVDSPEPSSINPI